MQPITTFRFFHFPNLADFCRLVEIDGLVAVAVAGQGHGAVGDVEGSVLDFNAIGLRHRVLHGSVFT